MVIYGKLPQAYRESFVFGGWPTQAFVHDPQTLRYFFYEVHRPKSIPRRLSSLSAEFGAAFCEAFQATFEEGSIAKLIPLCEEVLRPSGGWLSDGHVLHASDSWRVRDE